MKKYPKCKKCNGERVILVKVPGKSIYGNDYYEPCSKCCKEDIERAESDRYDLATCHKV